MRSEVRRRLEQVAAKNGRSVSYEAEMRVEAALRDEDGFEAALRRLYGPLNADWLLNVFGPLLHEASGIARGRARANEHWVDDLGTRRAVAERLRSLAAAIEGSGEPENPNPIVQELLLRNALNRSMATPAWAAEREQHQGDRAKLLIEWAREQQQRAAADPHKVLTTHTIIQID
jgi:hypothetical protein